MSSYSGSKWIIILLIYFMMLTTVITLTKFSSGGFISNELSQEAGGQCSNPRYIYEPYKLNPVSDTSQSIFINDDKHLQCSKSQGVESQTKCESINGCSWDSVNVSVWKQFWSFLPFYEAESPEPTCIGEIDAEYYNIPYSTSIFGTSSVTDGVFMKVSICTTPSVINSQELCDLFSCTWLNKDYIEQLNIEKLELNPKILSSLWNTIKEMFTFKVDFGFENQIIGYIINFFIFWLPLIILAFAIYLVLPIPFKS